MQIIIDDAAYIDVDRYNFTLVVKEPKRNTKDAHHNEFTTKSIGHYKNPLLALLGLRRYRLAIQDETITLDEYIFRLKKTTMDLNQTLERIESELMIEE